MASKEARYTITLNVTIVPEGDRRNLLIYFSMQEEGDHIMYEENPQWSDVPDSAMGVDPIKWMIGKLMRRVRPWLPKAERKTPPLEWAGHTWTGLKYGRALRIEKALHAAKGQTFRLGNIANFNA